MSIAELNIEPLQTGTWLVLLCGALCAGAWAHWLGRVRAPGRWTRTIVTALLVAAAGLALSQLWAGARMLAYALLASLMVYWLWAAYRRSTVQISSAARVCCVVLRGAVLGVLGIALLGPTAFTERATWKDNALLVLFDTSRSMQIRDVPGTTVAASSRPRPADAAGDDGAAAMSRWQAVVLAVSRNATAWNAALDRFEPVVLGFSDRVDTLSNLPAVQATGPRTGLGDAISAGLDRVAPSVRLAGVVIVSDGRNNLADRSEPRAAAAELAAAGIPLLAVGVGSEEPTGQTRTIALDPIQLPHRVTAGDPIPVEISFSAFGLADRPLRVDLLVDGEQAASRTITPERTFSRHKLMLTHQSEGTGVREIKVRVSPTDLQLEADLPEQLAFVTVADDQVDVLFLAGEPTVEAGFLARALAPYAGLRLHLLVLGRGAASSPLPTDAKGWLRYDAIVLHNVPASALTDEQWQDVVSAVADGGKGLMMAGGPNSFARGGHAQTPLASALPVTLEASAEAPTGPIRMTPTSTGFKELVCLIAEDRDKSLAAWAELPPLDHASTMGPAKPAAKIMMTDPDGAPILVGQGFGGGRTMAMAVYSTWEWQMKADRGRECLARFWQQVVLWLADRRHAVVLTTDRSHYDLGDLRRTGGHVRISFSAVNLASGGQTAKIDATLSVTSPSGKTTSLEPTRGPDGLAAEFRPPSPGTWLVTGNCVAGGEIIGRAEARFTVEMADRELDNLMPDLPMLRRLVNDQSGDKGRFFEIDQWPQLIQALNKLERRSLVSHQKRHKLTADLRWPLLLLIVGLLVVEWIIHRRTGMT